MQYRVQGIDAELEILAEDLRAVPELRESCVIEVAATPEGGGERLQQGVVIEMLVTISSGVLSTAATEVLRGLIHRARDRGAKVEEIPDSPDVPEDESGADAA